MLVGFAGLRDVTSQKIELAMFIHAYSCEEVRRPTRLSVCARPLVLVALHCIGQPIRRCWPSRGDTDTQHAVAALDLLSSMASDWNHLNGS
jgi:hypothetical protein